MAVDLSTMLQQMMPMITVVMVMFIMITLIKELRGAFA